MPLKICKKEAKTCLKTRKLRTLRISLAVWAMAILSGFAAFMMKQSNGFGANAVYWQFGLQSALCALTVGLLGALRQGRTAWLYCSACGKEPSAVQFLYWLRRGRGFRAARLFLEVRIRKAAWTLLLSLPGIALLSAGMLLAERQSETVLLFTRVGGAVCLAVGVVFACLVNQKYALAPILLARSPAKGVRSAVKASCFLMEDDCARLFRLKLSFLPWAICCIAVIPLAYVIPYYQQTETCMLRGILRAHTI